MSKKMHCDVEGCTETTSVGVDGGRVFARERIPSGWLEVRKLVPFSHLRHFPLQDQIKEMITKAKAANIKVPAMLEAAHPDLRPPPDLQKVMTFHVCQKHAALLNLRADGGDNIDDVDLEMRGAGSYQMQEED